MSGPVTAAVKGLKVAVLLGSTRDGRLGHNLANQVVASVKAQGGFPTLFDAKELKFPLLEKPYHHYKAPENPAPKWLSDVAEKFNETDAFILVDGEYNFTPSPGLINLLDHFYHAQYRWKAVGLAHYGGGSAGGARAGYVLRNMASELGLIVSPNAFLLPSVFSQFTPEGAFKDEKIQPSLDKFLAEFGFLAQTLKNARPNRPQ